MKENKYKKAGKYIYNNYIKNQNKLPNEGATDHLIELRADYKWDKQQEELKKKQEQSDKDFLRKMLCKDDDDE